MTETDWAIERVVRVVDGDTFDVILSRTLGELDGFDISATSKPTKPARLRPIHLDTPEEEDAEGYDEATADATNWLRVTELGCRLRVVTYGKDSFGRYLSDVYVDGDRANTFSRHMLEDANNGNGWPAYTGR